MKSRYSFWVLSGAVFAPLFFFLAGAPLADDLRVKRVIDGDSLLLSDGTEVRLIGVDTPEFEDPERNRKNARRIGVDLSFYEGFAQKSKYFVERVVYENDPDDRVDRILWNERREVRIERDPVNEARGHRDAYGRLLAYVYVRVGINEDTDEPNFLMYTGPGSFVSTFRFVLLNAEIIREGQGIIPLRFPFRNRQAFTQIQKQAKKERRGLWAGTIPPRTQSARRRGGIVRSAGWCSQRNVV